MSGLFAAAFLRQIGWECDVYERSPVELVGRGAGITTHPELLEALETEADRKMHEFLQSDEAMMEWIAVPNFLAEYEQGTCGHGSRRSPSDRSSP